MLIWEESNLLEKWAGSKSNAMRGEGGWKNLSVDSILRVQWVSMDGFPNQKIKYVIMP